MTLVFVGSGLCSPANAQEGQKLDLYLETGHSIGSAAFSPDGRTIASWGSYGTLKLWDVRSGWELDTLKGADGAAFSPDQKTVALLGLKDNTITVWDIESWRKLHSFTWSGGNTTSMWFSNGKTVAAWTTTKLTLWDTLSGNELCSFQGSGNGFFSAFFSSDLSTIAWLGNGKITLLDATSGYELQNLTADTNYGNLIFSPGGKTIAAWNDKLLTVWDAATGRQLHTLQGIFNGPGMSNVVFSPRGSMVAVRQGGNLRLWSVATGQELTGLGGNGIWSVTFSPDEKIIALSYGFFNDSNIALWNVGSPHPPRIVKQHIEASAVSRFSPDGKTLAIGAVSVAPNWSPNSIKLTSTTLWDVSSSVELPTLKEPSSLLIVEDGKRSLSWVEGGKTIKLLDSYSWRETGSLAGTLRVAEAGYSPDGKIILSWNDKGFVLWESTTGERSSTVEGSPGSVRQLVFSPDRRMLATIGDKTQLWDLTAGRQLHTLKGDAFAVGSYALSPDGTTLAAWLGRGRVLKLWDMESGHLLRTLASNDKVRAQHHGPSSNVSMVMEAQSFAAFSPRGNLIAMWISDERTVTLWEVVSGKRLPLLDGSEGISSSVVFSTDESKIAFASGTLVRVWDTKSGAQLRPLSGFERGELVFSADGKRIASAGANFTVRVWDVTSAQFHDFQGHTGAVTDIEFAPDNRTIASASSDNTIKLWDAQSGRLRLSLKGHGSAVSSVTFSLDGRTIGFEQC